MTAASHNQSASCLCIRCRARLLPEGLHTILNYPHGILVCAFPHVSHPSIVHTAGHTPIGVGTALFRWLATRQAFARGTNWGIVCSGASHSVACDIVEIIYLLFLCLGELWPAGLRGCCFGSWSMSCCFACWGRRCFGLLCWLCCCRCSNSTTLQGSLH